MRVLLTRTSEYLKDAKIIEVEENKFFDYLKSLQAETGCPFVVDTDETQYDFLDSDITDYHTELIERYHDIMVSREEQYGKTFIIPCDTMVEIYNDYRE